MTIYVGANTLSLVEFEKKRLKRVLKLLKNMDSISSIKGNLNYFVNLKDFDYVSTINLHESHFSLQSYQIDDNVYAYDYEINFASKSADNYYRGIILSKLNLYPIYDKIYKLDEEFKNESLCLRPCIEETELTDTIIKKTFADYANPYIIYELTNFGLGSAYEENPKIKPFVQYYAQSGKKICHMTLVSPEECVVLSVDGVANKIDVENWVRVNFSSIDDPTKIVEMAGYYNSTEKFYDLVRRI